MTRHSRILVPVDLNRVQWEQIRFASLLAARTSGICEIFYVVPSEDGQGSEEQAKACDKLMTLIAVLIDHYSSATADLVVTETTDEPIFIGSMQTGTAAERILQLASKRKHDVIVLGSQPASNGTSATGTIQKVVSSADCMVLVVPPQAPDIEPEAQETPIIWN